MDFLTNAIQSGFTFVGFMLFAITVGLCGIMYELAQIRKKLK